MSKIQEDERAKWDILTAENGLNYYYNKEVSYKFDSGKFQIPN